MPTNIVVSPNAHVAGARPKHGRVSFDEALRRLREGNDRFVNDLRSVATLATSERRASLAAAQSPFAVILSCSDSRVPSEMVFDQGLGDLFVVRVAGNVVAPPIVGSVEFAVEAFGVELVVVMGHTGCGAVKATVQALEEPDTVRTANLLDIVERIRPAVAPLASLRRDPDALLALATRANVRASADQLRHGSHILEDRIARGSLRVVGAEYSLETGRVDFFDGADDSAAPAGAAE
jgi:carbonic anhydrase